MATSPNFFARKTRVQRIRFSSLGVTCHEFLKQAKSFAATVMFKTELLINKNYTMRKLPKVMLHEHLDCSLRPRTMLELMAASPTGFPASFPTDIKDRWLIADRDPSLKDASREEIRNQLALEYQDYLVTFASASLANYVQAIVDHVLPLMQTQKNLYRITKERIEDAVADGIIAMELRFAPQLHTMSGLSLKQVMDSVCTAIDDSPIPVKLIICALRHEDEQRGFELADLVIQYRRYVGVFDLAADEASKPGVLRWFVHSLLLIMVKERLKCASPEQWTKLEDIYRTIHMWETNEPTADDVSMLEVLEGRDHVTLLVLLKETLEDAKIEVTADLMLRLHASILVSLQQRSEKSRIGHGIRGDKQGNRILEVCPTSNVVTGQVPSFDQHPIDKLLKLGRKVTVNTDGTLFTQVQLSDEYEKLRTTFKWDLEAFHAVNATALYASSFNADEQLALRAIIDNGYGH